MLIKEMQNASRLKTKVCCVIDDNPNKLGRLIEGIEIVGNRHDIVYMAKKYRITTIIYAIPSGDAKDRKDILNICKETNCRLRTIPGMYQLVINDYKKGHGHSKTLEATKNIDRTDGIGLQNMQDRVKSLKGNISIDEGNGYKIFVTFPK